MVKFTRHRNVVDYPDFRLYELITFLHSFCKAKWVVENVVPYYKPLIEPSVKIGRHLFWANFDIHVFNHPEIPKGFIKKSTLAEKSKMMDWLGIHFKETLYYGKNHCPVQVLRNCVHPNVGLQIYQSSTLNHEWK